MARLHLPLNRRTATPPAACASHASNTKMHLLASCCPGCSAPRDHSGFKTRRLPRAVQAGRRSGSRQPASRCSIRVMSDTLQHHAAAAAPQECTRWSPQTARWATGAPPLRREKSCRCTKERGGGGGGEGHQRQQPRRQACDIRGDTTTIHDFNPENDSALPCGQQHAARSAHTAAYRRLSKALGLVQTGGGAACNACVSAGCTRRVARGEHARLLNADQCTSLPSRYFCCTMAKCASGIPRKLRRELHWHARGNGGGGCGGIHGGFDHRQRFKSLHQVEQKPSSLLQLCGVGS